MIFAAMAAWQAWLVLGLAIAAAAGLFLLKLRPPQITVPSLTLWRRVLDERRDLTLWERIRWAVSFALAIVITAALTMALLAPERRAQAARADGQTGRLAIVIDSSWSMLAQTAGGRTRWDHAIARARALAASAGGEEIVLVTTADGVVEGPTADVALIDAALDRISPSGGERSPWPRVQGARSTYFLTDGAVARPVDPGVVLESMFEPAANVAITALDVRPAATIDLAGLAFLEVANYASAAQDVHVTVSRGNASLLDIHVNLEPGQAVQRTIPLDRGGDPRLRARVSAPMNALVVDDEAVAWIARAQPIAITLVSDEPAPLVAFLGRDPDVKLTVVRPQAFVSGSEDLAVFDRTVPPAPIGRPALVIAPPASSWLGAPGGRRARPAVGRACTRDLCRRWMCRRCHWPARGNIRARACRPSPGPPGTRRSCIWPRLRIGESPCLRST